MVVAGGGKLTVSVVEKDSKPVDGSKMDVVRSEFTESGSQILKGSLGDTFLHEMIKSKLHSAG